MRENLRKFTDFSVRRPLNCRRRAWGLHDIHGNAAEWTHSDFAPGQERKVVPGGTWRDIPACSTAGFRLGYAPWQRVYNVGFRMVLEPAAEVASQTP